MKNAEMDRRPRKFVVPALLIALCAASTARALSASLTTLAAPCGDFFGASISASPQIAVVGIPISFVAAIGGGTPPYSVIWTFGDGGTATGRSTTHVFESPGVVNVSVTVISSCKSSVSNTVAVRVLGYSPDGPDSLVVLGAGRFGDWTTEIELANPTDREQFGTVATVTTPNQLDGCPGSCIYHPYRLPPNGTTTVTLAPGLGAPAFIGAYYVVPDAGGDLPVAAARALRSGVPSHSLPVYRLNTLLESFVPNPSGDSAPQVLVGARRSETARSNLLLTVLQPPGTVDHTSVPLRVDLYGADGSLLATHDEFLGFGESRLIPDVVAALGVGSLDLGQVRVTQTGGTNLVRAALATALDGGATTVTSGLLPELGPIPDPAFDAAVIPGAGSIGDWDTELIFGDPGNFGETVSVSNALPARAAACEVEIGPTGTTAVLASTLSCLGPGSQPVYATYGFSGPETAARIFDRTRPSRSADLPVSLLRQLGASDLVFPFRAGRQNLFLMETTGASSASVHVEIRSAAGELLGSLDRNVAARGSLVIPDVLAAAGAGEADAGQIRVTASGYVSGALATLAADGSFVITAGENP